MTTSIPVTPASVSPSWLQTGPLEFGHNLAGGDRAYDQLTEVPSLTIPYAGVWEVSYSARTNIGVPSKLATLYVTTAVFANGGLIQGSEAIAGRSFNPGESAQDTIGRTFLYPFNAKDVVTLRAYRIGQDGTTQVISNADGRTEILARWVTPGF